ncbi:hybrid sensor histidine kinase/response regulator [Brevundimonas aurifodinae]
MTIETSDRDSLAIALAGLKGLGVGWWRVLDPKTTWWSPGMYEIAGLDPAAGVPTRDQIFRLYHPDDTNLVGRSWRRMFETDEKVQIRYRIVRPSGEYRDVVNWGQRQPPDAEGRRWVFGMSVDVSDHVDDRELFESERAFRFVAEHTSDMVVRSRMDAGITYASPASRAVLGYSPSEIVGMNPAEMVAEEDVTRIRAILRDRIARGELISPTGYEYRCRHKDGHFVWLEANPRLVLNGAGELTEIVDVVRDITARKEAQAALVLARQEAEAASSAKSEFLANMSHELRTPLTSILGFSRLIGRDGGLSEADRGHLDLIRSAGETLLAVVNDILDFSKLEAGALSLAPEAFSVAELGQGVVALLGGQADDKGLDLSCEAPAGSWLTGDAARLRQVLLNLVSNAVKFTEEGSVQVRLDVRPTTDGRAVLEAFVRDTGVGLDPAQIEQMFDRFTQADGSVSRRFGGTGLGLAISRRLIGMMGGEIGADSDGRSGSTFWFRVPLAVAAAVETHPITGPDVGPERRLRVLLAEDNPANRALIAALIAPLDLDLDMVENGMEAIAAARAGDYDLVLMDMQMPVMDGPSAARAIRSSPGPERDTPIVALTANVLPEQIEQCRAAGMQGHVAKPIDPRALFAALGEHARPLRQKAAAA